jgi:flagellar secretion chaperone FliS
MTPPNAAHANAYLRTKVLTASPEELRLMLLEGAVKFARQGREGMEARDYEAMYAGLSQARDIVFELMTTIRGDVDPDLAANARGLYAFIYRTIVEASLEKDAVKAGKAIELLEYERETWVLLMQKLAEERAAARPGGAPTSISVQG